MITLQEIREKAANYGACVDQYSKFCDLIDIGDEAMAWATCLGSSEWFQDNDIISFKEIHSHTDLAIVWDDLGFPAIKFNYKNGKLHGLYEKWYGVVKLKERCNYKNGKLDGVYEKWYDNGNQSIKYTYKNIKLDGLYQKWSDNGNLEIECYFKNGLLHGLCERYYPDGTLYSSDIYINGIKTT